MKITNLKTLLINQNNYHKNIFTRELIGTLYLYPVDYTPENCLACDGYLLNISDYQELYNIIGKNFNKSGDSSDKFRIPDYNITGKFLQPGSNVGKQIAAGIPNITGKFSAGQTSDGVATIFAASGAFYGSNSSKDYGNTENTGGSSATNKVFNFNASRSNTLFGASKTVQPPSQIVHICIRYK